MTTEQLINLLAKAIIAVTKEGVLTQKAKLAINKMTKGRRYSFFEEDADREQERE